MTPSHTASLEDALVTRKNNLDIIRFFAAFSVIFAHSFTITQGPQYSDLFSQISGGNLSLGGLAVGFFFFYGGFLIAKSCERRPHARQYFTARALRIFPELAFVILATTFIIGPLFTTVSLGEYFSSASCWQYLINIALIPQHALPGLFVGTPFGGDPNGALWTLPVEFICYIICYLVYKFTHYKGKGFLSCIVALIATSLIYTVYYFPFYLSVVRAIVLFCIGIVCYVYREHIKLDTRLGIASLLVFVALILLHLPTVAMIFVFPYMALYIGFGTKHSFSNFGKHGEFSYGIYLWGWPTQQCLVQLFGYSMPWWLNATLACMIVLPLAFINSRLVTEPLNRYLRSRRSKA